MSNQNGDAHATHAQEEPCASYVAGATIGGVAAGTCVKCGNPSRTHTKTTSVPLHAVGMLVRATHNPVYDGEYEVADRARRAWFNLRRGTIVRSSDCPGPRFCVQFSRGQAWYEPDELTPDTIASWVFEPTKEEAAGCAVLAEVAGRPEREAVLDLARRLASMTMERDALKRELSMATDARAAPKDMCEPLPQRPRVGLWAAGESILSRYGEQGMVVGSVLKIEEGYEWFARRPRHAPAQGEAGSEQDARAAVDAVLREWADLDGDEAADDAAARREEP